MGPNAATLHTSTGCTMPVVRNQTGQVYWITAFLPILSIASRTTAATNCDAAVDYNTGCGVKMDDKRTSYGPAFNWHGGGWYVMERATNEINVWFYPRYTGDVPELVKFKAGSLDTAQLGMPTANFPNTHCDIEKKFGPQWIVINLTFCGDWAGSPDVYGQSECPGTCIGNSACTHQRGSRLTRLYLAHRVCEREPVCVHRGILRVRFNQCLRAELKNRITKSI